MIFGSKDSFAIEACTEPDLGLPSAVWGRMRIWCQGQSFGVFENPYNSLFPAARDIREKIRDDSNFWDPTFYHLTDAQIFQAFNEAIYVGGDYRSELCERYWKFDFITNWGEHFDPLKGFLAFDPSGDSLLMIEDGREEIQSFRFPKARFIGAAVEFIHWFDSEAERLRGNVEESADGGQYSADD